MDTKPPTRTLPKLVMKEWPERDGETHFYAAFDQSIRAINTPYSPKSLSDFTRVLEGVEGQKETPLRKGDHE